MEGRGKCLKHISIDTTPTKESYSAFSGSVGGSSTGGGSGGFWLASVSSGAYRQKNLLHKTWCFLSTFLVDV